MKITAPEEYGLRCLLSLAKTGHSLTIPEIATAEGLSAPYVAKLMAMLRQAGIVDSSRGRAGGYALAASPEEIGLGSALLALGEPLFNDPGYCQQHAGSETGGNCVHHGGCTLRALWQTLEQWMRRTLDQITLGDLLQSEGDFTDLVRSRLNDSAPESVADLIPLTTLP